MLANERKGYRFVFLIAFIPALFFEALIFLHNQIDNIKNIIENDFRIILVTAKNKNIDKIKGALSKIEGIKNINFVSSDETLEKIKNSDKEFYLSLVNLGRSAIPDIIELEVDINLLARIEDFVDKLIKIDGIIDIRYKILEAYALTHFAFYSNFISVLISLAFLVLILLVVMGMLYSGFGIFFSSIKNAFKWFGCAVLGGLAAVLSFYIIIYPVKYLSPLWVWPSLTYHLIMLFSCGLLGWILYQWRKSGS